MEKIYHHVIASDLKRMAFQLVIRNSLRHGQRRWMKETRIIKLKQTSDKRNSFLTRKQDDDPNLVSTDEEDSDNHYTECLDCRQRFSKKQTNNKGNG